MCRVYNPFRMPFHCQRIRAFRARGPSGVRAELAELALPQGERTDPLTSHAIWIFGASRGHKVRLLPGSSWWATGVLQHAARRPVLGEAPLALVGMPRERKPQGGGRLVTLSWTARRHGIRDGRADRKFPKLPFLGGRRSMEAVCSQRGRSGKVCLQLPAGRPQGCAEWSSDARSRINTATKWKQMRTQG